jgi:hypothetical protein
MFASRRCAAITVPVRLYSTFRGSGSQFQPLRLGRHSPSRLTGGISGELALKNKRMMERLLVPIEKGSIGNKYLLDTVCIVRNSLPILVHVDRHSPESLCWD